MRVAAKWNRWVPDQEKDAIASDVLSATGGKVKYEDGFFCASEPLSKEESDGLLYNPAMGEAWYDAGIAGCLEKFRCKGF